MEKKKSSKIFLVSTLAVLLLLGLLTIVNFIASQATVAYASPEYFDN